MGEGERTLNERLVRLFAIETDVGDATSLPIRGRQVAPEVQRERPRVLANLVERLVEQHCKHGSPVCYFVTLFLCYFVNVQRPLLLLTWSQAVAEGLPREIQSLVGQRLAHRSQVGVETAFAHPCTCEEHAVAIFLLIRELARGDGVALVDDAALQHLVTGEERVDDVLVLVRRAHLHIDGTAVGGELTGRSIEPVVGLHGRMLVLHAEHHELLLHGVLATNAFKGVAAGLQRIKAHLEGLVSGYSFCCLFYRYFVILFLCYLVDDVAGNGLTGIIQIAERDACHAVGLNLCRHANSKSGGLVAQRQRSLAVMAFAGSIGGVGLHHEVIIARGVRVSIAASVRHLHRHLHRETAFVVGGQRVGDKRLIAFGTRAPPPQGTTAHDVVLHLRALHRDAGKALHMTNYRHGVAILVFLSDLVELHLEGRTLVLLNGEIGRAILRLDGELPREARCREHKVGGSLTKLIGSHLFLLHHLVVGIAQRQRQLLARVHLCIAMSQALIGNHRGMSGLSRPVELTVGQHVVDVLRSFVVVERVAATNPLLWRGIVLLGIDVDFTRTAFLPLELSLAATIGGERVHLSAVVAVVSVGLQTNLCTRHRTSRRGVHGHQSDEVIGQVLMHHEEVAHVEQHTLRAHIRTVGGELHKVDAHGQAFDGHRVLQHLVVGLSHIAARDGLLCSIVDDKLLQLCIVLVVVGFQIGVALDVQARDGHRQSLAVHELAHFHAPLGVRQLDAFADRNEERRQRQLVLGVAQDVHARPGSPVLQGVVDVVHLLFGRRIFCLVHELIALNGELATLLQVLIDVDERVDGLQILRLANLVHVGKAVLLRLIVCTDAGCLPVAVMEIPVVKRLIVFSLHTQHVQQVATEDMTVGTFYEGWLIAFRRLLRQLLDGLHRLRIVFG